jgi:hypothetical protein
MFQTLPYEPRQLQATEDRLARIYKAARLGLKGDNLALAAGMLPTEYARLKQFDGIAEYAEMKGRAEGEMQASEQLHTAAAQGDAKAALAILQNVHGWVAKQAITVDVNQSISITAALQEAERRVIDMGIINEAPDRANDQGPLINNREKDGDDYSNSNARPLAQPARLRP